MQVHTTHSGNNTLAAVSPIILIVVIVVECPRATPNNAGNNHTHAVAGFLTTNTENLYDYSKDSFELHSI